MRLPFGKKSSAPQQRSAPQQMSAPQQTRGRKAGGVPPSAFAQPRRQGNHWENQWSHPPAEPGMPGICGYLNGIQKPEEGHHPSRFIYIRPDGQPESKRMVADPTDARVPSVPSTRPVPRGFFGP